MLSLAMTARTAGTVQTLQDAVLRVVPPVYGMREREAARTHVSVMAT
jgi:hypothetical protein